MNDHGTNDWHKFSNHPRNKTYPIETMRTASIIVLAVVALATIESTQAGRIPEEIDNRLAELNKWFEARIPIYEKANYLLKKLGTEVAKLSDMHNGIDFYYEGYSDLQYYSTGALKKTPGMRIVKVTGNGADLKPVEEVVRKALAKRNIKNILHLAPEIKTAFKRVMDRKA